jgi:hypothetical protein
MVGSEENEPGDGWNYAAWLNPLMTHPNATAADIGKMAVNAYASQYGPDSNLTLAAIDLKRIKGFCDTFGQLATVLKEAGAQEGACIQTARASCVEYGNNGGFHHVDIDKVCRELQTRCKTTC